MTLLLWTALGTAALVFLALVASVPPQQRRRRRRVRPELVPDLVEPDRR